MKPKTPPKFRAEPHYYVVTHPSDGNIMLGTIRSQRKGAIFSALSLLSPKRNYHTPYKEWFDCNWKQLQLAGYAVQKIKISKFEKIPTANKS